MTKSILTSYIVKIKAKYFIFSMSLTEIISSYSYSLKNIFHFVKYDMKIITDNYGLNEKKIIYIYVQLYN